VRSLSLAHRSSKNLRQKSRSLTPFARGASRGPSVPEAVLQLAGVGIRHRLQELSFAG